MVIKNKLLISLIYPFIKHKERMFSFHYEQAIVDDEVITQSYVRQYIEALKEAVQAEIDELTEEYKL